MCVKNITEKLTKTLQKFDESGCFIPPNDGDILWEVGSETFTRDEVAYLLWTQIAMISNDLKTFCGKDLSTDMFDILNDPRIPEF